jgi:LacI family transcriptional regulator
MRRVTSKTIAADLGLTTAAVSIALNPTKTGTSKVSAATAERVRAYAAKLNYRPSFASRAMRSKQLRQVAFLLESDFGDRRRPPIVEMPAIFGLNDFLDPKGWHLNIVHDKGERRPDLALPRYLQESSVDGVILSSGSQQRDEAIGHDLKRFSIPSIYLNACREFNSVGLDDRWGAAVATRYLIELGHREIVFVGSNITHSSLPERQAGYKEAMEEHGLKACCQIYETEEGDQLKYPGRLEARRAFGQWFVQEFFLKQRPTAIFCYDDCLALQLLRALHQSNISVPGDVSVIGFNDMPFVDSLSVALTTMRSDFYRLGQIAGELLFKLIENPAQLIPSVTIKPSLIERETTGKIKGS